MPRKTKKQKIIAELHRKSIDLTKQNFQPVKRQNYTTAHTQISAAAPSFEYNKNVVIKPKITTLSADYAYIKGDLLRITIFTFLAFFSQVVLYFLIYKS